jgi:U3 small nucleolar RNA-associated protein MPP10
LKLLYDTTKKVEIKTNDVEDDTLPELIVEDFDEEQIWQELELQNSARLKLLANTIKKFSNNDLIFINASDGKCIVI